MADVTPAIPTLSQVRSAGFDHLTAAAAQWRAMTGRWVAGFSEVRDEATLPGGSVWQGQAADALQARTAGDVTTIIAPADQLHAAAGIAERGYDQLTAHRDGVLEAVADAGQDGFTVSDTYGITDTRTSHNDTERAERQKLATEHANFIRHRVMGLISADQEIATKIDTAAAGLEGFTFGEEADDEGPRVQLVDNPHPDVSSWTAPPRAPDVATAQKNLEDLQRAIEYHNQHPPLDPSAVAAYNSEANYYNTWAAILEGEIESWETDYKPASLAQTAGTPTSSWTGPPIPELPQAPTGQSGSPVRVTPGGNQSTWIYDTHFSGHALDQMQGRGITLSAVMRALHAGSIEPGKLGTTIFYDSANNVSVVQSAEGNIITVSYGHLHA